MDQIVSAIDRHRNGIAIGCLMVIGVFIVLLLFSNAGDAAQALGNLIGAMIGALGGAAAIYWQIDRKRREDDRRILGVRISALRPVIGQIRRKTYELEQVMPEIVSGRIKAAATLTRENAMGVIAIDRRLSEEIGRLAPRDITDVDDLNFTNGRVWQTADNLFHGQGTELEYCEAIVRFCEVACMFLDDGNGPSHDSKSLEQRLFACLRSVVRHGQVSGLTRATYLR